MKRFIAAILFPLIIMFGCNSSEKVNKEQSSQARVMMIIDDFCKKNRSYLRKYNVFSIEDKSIPNKNFYMYNVFPESEGDNFYSVYKENSYLPADYIKYEGKIFLLEIFDKNFNRKHTYLNVMKCLDSLNMLDSIHVKLELGLLKPNDVTFRKYKRDGSKRSVDYIICKDKPNKVRMKVRTNLYESPEDDRYQNLCD